MPLKLQKKIIRVIIADGFKMIKSSKPISINILSVFIILISLLICVVGSTNSWFTIKQENAILVEVTINHINLKLYQNSVGDANEILTNEKNDEAETVTKKYIQLDGEILPDTPKDLHLILKNADAGQSAMYVRYKFELMLRGVDADVPVDVELTDATLATSSSKGFVKDTASGYYYYKTSNATNAENALYTKGTETDLLKSFTVPYSSFVDTDASSETFGDFKIKNSDTIYIKLTIEAYADKNF